MILMKVLYQQLWGDSLAWDEEVPHSYQEHHTLWKSQLHLLAQKCLPRCYYRTDKPCVSIQIHGFSDASEKAYSAVIYLRSTYKHQPPLVSLVSAKTKVAPLKSMSVPRLEFCGAQLLSKLISNVRHALSLPLDCVTAWSDSTIVLAWLDGAPKI